MEKCTECADGTIKIVKYTCRENDYALLEDNGDVIESYDAHGLASEDSEIGEIDRYRLCSCGKRFEI
tara:strand:+ start:242 stop:442 length:201 start_codon:yes stop_codon:yes gene_type:complete